MTRSATFTIAILTLWSWPHGHAQSSAPPADVPSLVRQLGDPKVRLRDQAEAKLRVIPEAAAALEEAAATHPSEEARVRAQKILESAVRNRWHLSADLGHGHLAGFARPPLRICVSRDLTQFLTQGQDHACLWDTASFNPARQFGKPNGSIPDWEGAAPMNGFTLSPDGKTAITSDDSGTLLQTDTSTGNLVRSWSCFDKEVPASAPANMKAIWSISFTPDGKHLVTGGRDGILVVREFKSLQRAASLKVTGNTLTHQAYSPDGRWLLLVADTDSAVDYIHIIDTTSWRVMGQRAIRDLINSLTFFKDGTRFIASGRHGHIATWDFDTKTGSIGIEETWGNYAGGTIGIVLSSDETSIMVASRATGKALCEYGLKNRKILWSDTHTATVTAIAALGSDRFITSGSDHRLRIWKRSPLGTANPPPPLVRMLADTLDPAEGYQLKFEADPHQQRPCLVDTLLYLPNSELLVTRGHDKIQISSAEDLSSIRSFGPQAIRLQGYLSRSTCGAIAVTKDEQTVIAADDDGVIGFYDIETGKLTRSFPTSTRDAVSSLSPNELATMEIVPDHEETILYTSDNQQRVCAWDMATGKLRASTLLPAPGAKMRLSPDGALLIIRTLNARSESLQILVATSDLRLLDVSADAKESSYGLGTFSEDGNSFLRPERDGQLSRLLMQKQSLGAPEALLRLPKILYQISLADDGRRAICAADGVVPLSVWDLEAKRILWMTDGNRGGLFRAIPLGADRIVTLGLENNKLRLYKRNTPGSNQ